MEKAKLILQYQNGAVRAVEMSAKAAAAVAKHVNAGGKYFVWGGVYYPCRTWVKLAHMRVERD